MAPTVVYFLTRRSDDLNNTQPDMPSSEGSTEAPPPLDSVPTATTRHKNTRSRSGCLNCRRRKRKCDERRPTCRACARRSEACEWGLRVTFRSSNAFSTGGDFRAASTRHGHGDNGSRRRGPPALSDSSESLLANGVQTSPSASSQFIEPSVLSEGTYGISNVATSPGGVPLPSASDQAFNLIAPPAEQPISRDYRINVPALVTPTSPGPASLNTDNSVIATLVSLRHGASNGETVTLPQYSIEPSSSFSGDALHHDYATAAAGGFPSPESSFDDSIFRPGSAYHELHSTLRSHIIHEAQSNAPTRSCTPVAPSGPGGGNLERDSDKSLSDKPHTSAHGNGDRNGNGNTATWDAYGAADVPPVEWPSHLLPDDHHDAPALSQEDEAVLWTNWFEEIAPWLDKFDNQRHFQHALPTMARASEPLRYAMLALSARQMERKEQEQGKDGDRDGDRDTTERGTGQNATTTATTHSPTGRSLALYQQAIHLLLPQLHTRATAVVAACVVLCVLEMMSCAPKAWKRHLDGCAALMQAVGAGGFVGGVEQALFWCFARMDVCGGLISSVRTLIPVRIWAASRSSDNLDADEALFRSPALGFDMAANHAVYLMAQVLDLLYAQSPTPVSSVSYRARWLKLWRCVEDWRARRPAELHEILAIPPSDTKPFPTVLYSNPAAISGNQLHHTAAVLLLQNLPASVRFSSLVGLVAARLPAAGPAGRPPPPQPPRSVLWHARQICGISLTNHHHGAWTNSIQPLWIAGRCMSHMSEHRAILALLRRIQRESGWAAQWRADDLIELWGD